MRKPNLELRFMFVDRISPLLSECAALLSKLDCLPSEGREGVFDFAEAAAQVVGIQSDVGTAGTGEVTVACDPTDAFRIFCATLRAREGNFLVGDSHK
jgi:hypothetical protein